MAGDTRRQQHVARRNRAIRAAHARGVTKTTLARATGLSEATVGQALKGEPTSD
ncbi:helix-turn-helix domain-containing protein [Streptomyces decoyicus]